MPRIALLPLTEKSKKITIESIRSALTSLQRHLEQNLFPVLEKAEYAEEFMRTKREILHTWVTCMPIGMRDCYFCNYVLGEKFENCHECQYGDIHGICVDDGSDYAQIVDTINKLTGLILESYFTPDDKYGEVIPNETNPSMEKSTQGSESETTQDP